MAISTRQTSLLAAEDWTKIYQTFKDADFQSYDLYTIDIDSGEFNRITNDVADEKSPAFSPDGTKIAYISDNNGIDNIYLVNIEDKTSYPVTNLLTGVSQVYSDQSSCLCNKQ